MNYFSAVPPNLPYAVIFKKIVEATPQLSLLQRRRWRAEGVTDEEIPIVQTENVLLIHHFRGPPSPLGKANPANPANRGISDSRKLFKF